MLFRSRSLVPPLGSARKENQMKLFYLCCFFCISSVLFCQSSKYPSGIIYGPKAAFKIDAPKGWILDNKAGLSNGLPCVLYLKGSTWKDSPVIMYAKIASTEFENVDEFIKFAIKGFLKEDSNFVYQRHSIRAINKSNSAIVNNYIGGPYHSYERVAYIQVPQAVCYIVFSSSNKEDFAKYSDALLSTVDTFVYKPEYIKK